ncbi:GH17554 [Drosophila grimshawi]|uniref:GH17554 n=2 Tax=Drosophila grimshawi TaxID=7222 RepID=B4JST1_DROGR|nr:GH17554 [Drosophila grimshawi]
MRELDDILSENNTDADRLTAFLKLKAEARPQNGPQFVLFGGGDISLDVDVDLIKLPAATQAQKQRTMPEATQKAAQHEKLRSKLQEHYSDKNAEQQQQQQHILVAESQPQPELLTENIPPLARSHSLSAGHVVPSPARASIYRRPRSIGRDLLNDFDNVANDTTAQPLSSQDFLPEVSSTPALRKPTSQQQKQHNGRQEQQRSPAAVAAAVAAVETMPCHEDFESIFQSSLINMQRRSGLLSTQDNQLPTAKSKLSKGATFIVLQQSDEPAQLQQLPAKRSTTGPTAPATIKELCVKLRRLPQKELVKASPSAAAQNGLQRVVPESYPDVEEMMRVLHSPEEATAATTTATPASAVAASVSCGIQTSCQNGMQIVDSSESDDEAGDNGAPQNLAPSGGNITRRQRLLQQKPAKATTREQLLDLHCTRMGDSDKGTASTQKLAQAVLNKPSGPAINVEEMMRVLHSPEKATAATTTATPASAVAASVSCGIQTSCQNGMQIVDSSESDDEAGVSGAPLNLAPSSGNITRRQHLLQRQPAKATTHEQLLDLHCTRTGDSDKGTASTQKLAQAVLNKPSRPAINGEQFAMELARMSNYEILDLRKRSSNGRLIPLNGQKTTTTEEQRKVVVQSIQRELQRRNLPDPDDELPNGDEAVSSSVPVAREPLPPEISMLPSPPEISMLTPPAPASPPYRFRNPMQRAAKNQLDTSRQKQRLGKRRDPPMTAELQNYLILSQTIEERIKKHSGLGTKRSLYTKGNSDFEDNNLSPVPAKQHRFSIIQIAPAPPTDAGCSMPIGDIPIVSPPPASIRYSQCMRRSRKSIRHISPLDVAQESGASQEAEDEGVQQEQQQDRDVAGVVVEEVERELVNGEEDEYVDEIKEKVMEQEVQERAEEELTEDEVMREEVPEHLDCESEAVVDQDEVEAVVEQEEAVAVSESESVAEAEAIMENDRLSTEMEELRMQIVTPPLDVEQTDLDDRPSTSKATREALQRSMQKQSRSRKQNTKQRTKQTTKSTENEEAVFKKPSAPAPRKKPGLNKILKNLEITLVNETLPPEENEARNAHDETSGVRRSRRGQVPLRNTWVHSISNPFKHTFFERSLSSFPVMKVKKLREGATLSWSTSVTDEAPLYSSTPHIQDPVVAASGSTLKRKRHDKRHEPLELTGISRLADVTEEAEEQSLPHIQQTTKTATAKYSPLEKQRTLGKLAKKSRTRIMSSDSTAEAEAEPMPMLMPLSEEAEPQADQADQAAPEPAMPKKLRKRGRPKKNVGKHNHIPSESEAQAEVETEAAQSSICQSEPVVAVAVQPRVEVASAPIITAAEAQLLQAISWLRCTSDVPRQSLRDDNDYECETDSMRFTSVADLEFTTMDGLDYAFYNSEESYTLGFIRFQPLQERGSKRNKTNILRFIAIIGEFDVELECDGKNSLNRILKPGDMVEIKKGNCFNIINRLNEVSVLIVNRK